MATLKERLEEKSRMFLGPPCEVYDKGISAGYGAAARMAEQQEIELRKLIYSERSGTYRPDKYFQDFLDRLESILDK